MNIHQNMVIFFEKTMKAYFKVIILLLKVYENILNFNFLMGGGRGGRGRGVLDVLTVFIVL